MNETYRDELGERPPEFSFQNEVDALKIFGPIATKKSIETQAALRENHKKSRQYQNGQRFNHVTYQENRRKNQVVKVKLPNQVTSKPSTASLDMVSNRSSFREITEGDTRKKRNYNQIVLSPWDDQAAKNAIHKMRDRLGKYNYHRPTPSPPRTNNPMG